MNLLTLVELHQCGQSEFIITLITEYMAVFLGEELFVRDFFLLPFSCLAHICFGLYCHCLSNNQHFSLLGPEVKHCATLIVFRVREETTYMV